MYANTNQVIEMDLMFTAGSDKRRLTYHSINTSNQYSNQYSIHSSYFLILLILLIIIRSAWKQSGPHITMFDIAYLVLVTVPAFAYTTYNFNYV